MCLCICVFKVKYNLVLQHSLFFLLDKCILIWFINTQRLLASQVWLYSVPKRKKTPNLKCFFTCRPIGKLVIKWLLKIPTHLKYIATLSREIFLLEDCPVKALSKATHYVMHRCSKHTLGNIFPVIYGGGMLAWLCVWVKVKICISPDDDTVTQYLLLQ